MTDDHCCFFANQGIALIMPSSDPLAGLATGKCGLMPLPMSNARVQHEPGLITALGGFRQQGKQLVAM